MMESELEKNLSDLKNIKPSADFCISSREQIISFVSQNGFTPSPLPQQGFIWLKFRPIAVLAVAVLMVVLGSELLPSFEKKNNAVVDVSSIKNEWQLADVSPYLNKIFEEEILISSNDNPTNLALASSSDNKNQRLASKFSPPVISNNSIPNLGVTEVDRAIDSLTF